ncbi:Uncharacterised protein [Clostridioides difficile]|nr:Uncharacterised protein [Clostridioides difficile]VHT46427.1 Uncharacterised protein [Clostridioides difficile]
MIKKIFALEKKQTYKMCIDMIKQNPKNLRKLV